MDSSPLANLPPDLRSLRPPAKDARPWEDLLLQVCASANSGGANTGAPRTRLQSQEDKEIRNCALPPHYLVTETDKQLFEWMKSHSMKQLDEGCCNEGIFASEELGLVFKFLNFNYYEKELTTWKLMQSKHESSSLFTVSYGFVCVSEKQGDNQSYCIHVMEFLRPNLLDPFSGWQTCRKVIQSNNDEMIALLISAFSRLICTMHEANLEIRLWDFHPSNAMFSTKNTDGTLEAKILLVDYGLLYGNRNPKIMQDAMREFDRRFGWVSAFRKFIDKNPKVLQLLYAVHHKDLVGFEKSLKCLANTNFDTRESKRRKVTSITYIGYCAFCHQNMFNPDDECHVWCEDSEKNRWPCHPICAKQAMGYALMHQEPPIHVFKNINDETALQEHAL